MGRAKDEELQRQYAERKQARRKVLLHKLGIGGAVIAAAAAYFTFNTRHDSIVPQTEQEQTHQETQGRQEGIPYKARTLDDFTHDDVAEVITGRSGEKPVVIIPMLHVGATTQGHIVTDRVLDIVKRIRRTTMALHDKYGINGLVLEGIGEEDARKLRAGKVLVDALAQKRDTWTVEYNNLISDRRWLLHGSVADERSTQEPFIQMRIKTYQDMEAVVADFQKNGWMANKEVAQQHFPDISRALATRVYNPYANALRAYLKEDPEGRKAYGIYLKRNDHYLAAAERAYAEGGQGVIIVVGAAHEQSLSEMLKKGNRSYYVVRPKDVPALRYRTEQEQWQDWMSDRRAHGSQESIFGDGFTLTVKTGLDDVFKELGMLPSDKHISKQEARTSPAQENSTQEKSTQQSSTQEQHK